MILEKRISSAKKDTNEEDKNDMGTGQNRMKCQQRLSNAKGIELKSRKGNN